MTVWATNLNAPPSWVGPSTLSRQVWDATTAKAIPGVGRALGIYGMVSQCALLHMSTSPGSPSPTMTPLGTPRMLQRPDPDVALPTWIQAHVDDWFLHGNACHLITALGADGWPAAARYFPAHRWSIQNDERRNQPVYMLDGQEVARDRVVHVRRGTDPAFEWRGVGVVEQFLGTLNKSGLETAAESALLANRGMPSVAIIKPNAEHDPVNDDKVAEKWEERFGGSTPKPGIFPQGTTIVPLSWHPSDQQMVQARGATLKDIANAANLDPYWLGAEGSSHTYRSPSPMFLTLLRTSLGPMLRTFEDEWSFRWLPYGRQVAFDRLELLRDDLQTMVDTFTKSTGKPLFPDPNEPRRYMGFPELPESAWPAPPEIASPGESNGQTNEEPPPAEDPPAQDDGEDPPA